MINFELVNGSCDPKNVTNQMFQRLYYLISILEAVKQKLWSPICLQTVF